MRRSRLSAVGKFHKGQHVLVRVFSSMLGETPIYKTFKAVVAGQEGDHVLVKSPELAMERVSVPFPLYKKLKVSVPVSQVKHV
jgi:predicted SnoaL-like aldol condensation-catalyzing enzyme